MQAAGGADEVPVVLFPPRLRLAVMTVICWIMTLFFAGVLYRAGLPRWDFAQNELRDVALRLFVSALGALFLLFAVPFSLQLVARRPTLVIDREGVSGDGLWTRLRWDDIDQVRLVEYGGERYVGFELRDLEDYLATQRLWIRVATRINARTQLPPLCVLERLLPMPAAGVVELLQRRLERRREAR